MSAKIRRRSISISAISAAFVIGLTLAPLLFVVSAIIDVVLSPRHFRHTRLLAMVLYAIAVEMTAIVLAALSWIAVGGSGGLTTTRSLRLHHRLQCWYIAALMSGARTTCGLRIEVDDPAPASRGNAIVIGRHTSIADAMIPALLFANRFDIATRYVLKDDLLWGPAFDLVGGRLRNHFVDRAPSDSAAETAAIRALADDLDEHSVAVIFPEGTFFDAARKARAVARLRDAGRIELAERAAALQYLLPPRPAGTLALLAGAPDADVVVVGNAGLERFGSRRDIYRSVPFRMPVRVWLWRVPNSEIPREPAAQLDWLYRQWAQLDASIAAHLLVPSH